MSYEPTVWVDGVTPVNAENLNKLEAGVQAAAETGGLSKDEVVSAVLAALPTWTGGDY